MSSTWVELDIFVLVLGDFAHGSLYLSSQQNLIMDKVQYGIVSYDLLYRNWDKFRCRYHCPPSLSVHDWLNCMYCVGSVGRSRMCSWRRTWFLMLWTVYIMCCKLACNWRTGIMEDWPRTRKRNETRSNKATWWAIYCDVITVSSLHTCYKTFFNESGMSHKQQNACSTSS